jgi:hypothetical protein
MASTNGRIWIDTTLGANGDGSAADPCNSLAAALAIAGRIKQFEVLPGSTITFQQALSNAVFYGEFYTAVGGSQILTNVAFHNATLSDIFHASSILRGYRCDWSTLQLPPGTYYDPRFDSGTVSLCAGNYVFISPVMRFVTSMDPTIDFGASVGTTQVITCDGVIAWQVENVKAGESLSLNSTGRVNLKASCTGGLAVCRSDMDGTKEDGAGITLDTSFGSKANLIDADQAIDTTASPWALVHYPKGTFGDVGATELLRQTLYDVAGNPVTSTRQVIGRTLS